MLLRGRIEFLNLDCLVLKFIFVIILLYCLFFFGGVFVWDKFNR